MTTTKIERRLDRLEERAPAAPDVDALPLSEGELCRLVARALRGDLTECAAVVYDPAAHSWRLLRNTGGPLAAALNRLHAANPGAVLFPLLADELAEGLAMLDAGRWRIQLMNSRKVSIIGWPGDQPAWSHGATVRDALNVALAQIDPPSAPSDLEGLRALLLSLQPLDGERCN